MDPVNILPVEVIHEIWCKLPFADILSCMIVSRSWYESISDCSKLWRPLCSSTNLTNGNTWKSLFIKEAKVRWSWRKGLFKQKNEIKLIDGYKILNCNEDNIYIVDEKNKLWKYDQAAVNLASIQLEHDCVQMCTMVDKVVVLLCVNTVWNELIFFNELFEELARVRTKIDNKIYKAGDKLWTWEYANNNIDMMSVYCAKNLEQVEQVNIPYGTTVMPLQSGWCTLDRGEVWWFNGNNKTKLYARYMSPMASPCIDILTNNKDSVVILDTKRISVRETKFNSPATWSFLVTYFKYKIFIDIVFNKTLPPVDHRFSTVLIYCNDIRKHRSDIMDTVIQMCFSGELLILRTAKNIFTVNKNTGVQQEFDCSWESTYSVHDLLEHSKLAWILIKQNYEVLIYDANSAKCLTSIMFSCNTENLIFSYKMLVVPESKVKLIVKYVDIS